MARPETTSNLPSAAWKAHDMNRPRPPVITPGEQNLPHGAPSDAVVLFDGTDLSAWRSADGGPSKWVAKDGYMESVPGSGYVYSRQSFGDVQLHVEWATPTPAEGTGQGRGNSGVYLMGLYEVQVLDSYENITYADGQAGALYGQYPPLVNASRPPGEWQSFDIVFRRPRFDRDGNLERPARMTVLHNGVVVQDAAELWGPTLWLQHGPYRAHPDKLPISLQDHGNPVRYRNIWLRELHEFAEPGPPDTQETIVDLPTAVLQRYTGRYDAGSGGSYRLRLNAGRLEANINGQAYLELVPHSTREMSLRHTAGELVFELGDDDQPVGVTFHLGGSKHTARKVE
jgi:hypothetical protein